MVAGIRPSRASEKANCASSAAIAISQARPARRRRPWPRPAPRRWSASAWCSGGAASRPASARRPRSRASRVAGHALHPGEIGAGGEALAAAGQEHDARMAASPPAVASAAVSSAISPSSKALWQLGPVQREGRLAPLRSISMQLMTTHPGSHPEDAEARLLDGRVEGRREAEPQHPPAVGRGDDAVVPEPRAGVIGMALASRIGRGSAP